jgi:hypothetical protein
MFNYRIRIFSSLLIAFIFINLYGRLSTTPFISPIQAENVKNLLSNIKFNPNSLVKFFTIKFDSKNDELVSRLDNRNNSFSLTPVPQTSSAPAQAISQGNLTPTLTALEATKPSTATSPTKIPTKAPTPTPRPTKPPKPTPTPVTPPVDSVVRPGSTLKEIYELVQERMCVPAALLYAFQQAETGAWWPVGSPSSKVKIYNKYGWWLDGSGSSCTGMGYYTQIGIVPPDAVDAGTVCQNPIPSGADQAIMGLWQISKYEEDAVKKSIGKYIKGSIDRRVIFDNAIIFAIITKNRLGDPPKNCSDWPADAIKTAAEKHYGNCSDNYCNKVLNYYREYK